MNYDHVSMSFPTGARPIATVAIALLLLLAPAAHALIEVHIGSDPIGDNNWPAGSMDVANLKTRLGWWEGPPFGGGEHQFLYRGDTAAFQQALDAFAKIRAPHLSLVVHSGPHDVVFLKDEQDPKSDARVDWTFTVWNPQSWNHLYNNPTSQWNAEDPNFRKTVAPPRIDVYIGGGEIDFKAVKVPDSVKVEDERASAHGIAGGSALLGDVYDVLTSKPIAGATITLTRNNGQNEKHEYVWETVASGQTDANGHLDLKAVPAGNYRATATSPGMSPLMLGYTEFGSDTLKRYTARLSPAVTLAGTVTDPAGKPVAGATVRADSITGPDGRGYDLPDRPQATADATGHFVIQGLPRGHCHLFTYLTGYHGLDVLKVYEIPADSVSLQMTAAGTFKAKVANPDGTPPKGGYVVHLIPEGGEKIGKWSGSGNIAANGTIHFDDVPPGKYTATAHPNPGPAIQGKDPTEQQIEIKPGETAEVMFLPQGSK